METCSGPLEPVLRAVQMAGQALREGLPGSASCLREAIEKEIRCALPGGDPGSAGAGGNTRGAFVEGMSGGWRVGVVPSWDGPESARRGSTVSVALVSAGRPVLGVVYAFDWPDDEGTWFAWAEGMPEILCNGRPAGPGREATETLSLWEGADRQAAAYNGNDDADLINFLSSTDGDVVVLFNEQKGGKVKVSWRARPGLDISTLALRFGGGGHPAAAGAEISGTIEEVREKVLSETRAFLAAHRP